MAIFRDLCACLYFVRICLRRGRGRQVQRGQAKILVLKIRGCIQCG